MVTSQTGVPPSSSSAHAASRIRAASFGVGGVGFGGVATGGCAEAIGLYEIHRHRTARVSAPDRIQWTCRIDEAANGRQRCAMHLSLHSCGREVR